MKTPAVGFSSNQAFRAFVQLSLLLASPLREFGGAGVIFKLARVERGENGPRNGHAALKHARVRVRV